MTVVMSTDLSASGSTLAHAELVRRDLRASAVDHRSRDGRVRGQVERSSSEGAENAFVGLAGKSTRPGLAHRSARTCGCDREHVVEASSADQQEAVSRSCAGYGEPT